MMLRLGVIGTHTISDQMVKAAHGTGKYKLTAVYSRKMSTAKEFGTKYHATHFFTNLDEFMTSGKFDVVYIASPNSLHFSQAVLAIENNLDIIVEKPAFVNPTEFKKIEQLLGEHPQAHLVEAARHIHTPLSHSIQAQIAAMDHLQGAEFYAMKYSARYDQVLGQLAPYPNIFRQKFAGGALMDMGVYGVYAAITLFGKPLNVNYLASFAKETHVDTKGTATLQYPDFNVIVNTGKTTNTNNASEIYGLQDLISVDSIFDTKKVIYFDNQGNQHLLNDHPCPNTMTNECEDFAEIFMNPHSTVQNIKYQYWFNLSRIVNRTLYRLRKTTNLTFPSDER